MALISKSTQNDITQAATTALAMGFSESLTNYLAGMGPLSTVLNTKLNQNLFQIGVGALVLTSAKAGRVRGLARTAAIATGTGMIASGTYNLFSGITSNILQGGLNTSLLSGLGSYEGPAISASKRAGLNGLRGVAGGGLGTSMLNPMV